MEQNDLTERLYQYRTSFYPGKGVNMNKKRILVVALLLTMLFQH